jgi:hypothetical protein
MTDLTLKLAICLAASTIGLRGAQRVPPQNEGAPSSVIDTLISILAQNEIGTIEVFRLPKNLRSFSAIEPQDVESGWYDKLTIRIRTEQPELIVKALRSARLKPWDRSGAGYLRWGFVFYSAHNRKRVTALYFDETGHYGSVGGAWVSFGDNILSRLRTALYFSLD